MLKKISIALILFVNLVFGETIYEQNITVSTVAGSGVIGATDGNSTTAKFNYPSGVVVDKSGNIFVAGNVDNKIRKITPDGNVTTFAGSGYQGSTDGTGISASFNYPYGIYIDSSGFFYITDSWSHKLRKITPDGNVTTFAGSGYQGFTDGTGISASFSRPTGTAKDSLGNLYVADFYNNTIRKVTSNGNVSTFAGNLSAGSADGNSSVASFSNPTAIVIDSSNIIYVADGGNNKIRKVTLDGNVTTIAGSGVIGSADGNSSDASFSAPQGLAIDSNGSLYIADHGNNKIRKITFANKLNDSTSLSSTKSGWYLYGTSVNITIDEIYNIKPFSILWKYSNGKWSAMSKDPTTQAIISNANYSIFSTVNAGEGVWVLVK